MVVFCTYSTIRQGYLCSSCSSKGQKVDLSDEHHLSCSVRFEEGGCAMKLLIT